VAVSRQKTGTRAYATGFSNRLLDSTQPIPLADLGSVLERVTVLYIPGGNTYLLLDRLYRSKAFRLIQVRVEAGVPLVGFSAGMIICGQNILTTNDDNECGSTEFTGLGFKVQLCCSLPCG
jgi:peptidase E